MKFIINMVLGLAMLLPAAVQARAEEVVDERPILIISSYNPETYQTSKNISEFLDEYKSLGGTAPIVIENMNCKSFSEALRWKGLMKDILCKYSGRRKPQIIMLLGQEAWSAYISQDTLHSKDVPVLCGMVSRNVIVLPHDTVDLESWEPEPVDFEDSRLANMKISGFAYEYNIETNIRLIHKLFPLTEHIAFISDNSYGGISMQAHMKAEMKNFPEYDLILLDGRRNTIYTLVDRIADLPPNTVILVGTWRVDKNDSYFMRNATYSMMGANPHVPAFTLASVGMGHWVIGGYTPDYKSIGNDLARQAMDIQQGKVQKELIYIPCIYIFDYNKLQEFHIDASLLPPNSQIQNIQFTFFEKYKYQIVGVASIILVLLIAFLTTFWYYLRTKRLKDQLQESEVELVAAKERAEESDRLKSAFLANMSHEIRTPLNAIVGFSNVLVAEDCSVEERQQFVGVIQTNSDLLLRLIGDILDISRLETGRLKFAYEEYDAVELCHNVLATTSYSKKEGVSYVFKPRVESFRFVTDVQRIQQVLINLLTNANKFTVKGEITLDFELDEKGKYIMFSVSDTGPGVPAEKQEKVFERFEKLNEYAQGTGLGLAICRITIGLLGGKIWIDSHYKKGARFVFTHPLNLTTNMKA